MALQAYAGYQANGKIVEKDKDWESGLAMKVLSYVNLSDNGEEVRRREDRIGSYLYYGHHWRAPWPAERAAITANLGYALVDHCIAIKTKQMPIPIVECNDAGDESAAEVMRNVIMNNWRSDQMQLKLRKALKASMTMRTSAFKVLWDTTERGGAGDISTDVIQGFNIILDSRCNAYDLMEFAGDRARMSRAKAMMLYPESARKVADAQDSIGRNTKSTAPSGNPIKDPWGSGPLPVSGAAIINSKPTVTAFAGELGIGNEPPNMVDICEVYHKDYSLERKEEPVRNHLGEIVKDPIRDEDGFPIFEALPDEEDQAEDGTPVGMPNFKLVTQPRTEEKLVRVYPFWRRTTMLLQDQIVLDDIPWDGPLPYVYFNDIEPLSGLWSRGSLMQLETLQTQLNVSLSAMTDNLRFGSLQAFWVGNQAQVLGEVMYPGPGQMIPCQDPKAIEPIQVPQLSEAWFSYIQALGGFMENVIGAKGVMQGESQGRLDSASGYDLLAEIGGSRLVESTQRMEMSLGKWAELVGWFAQRYYTEKHAIKVEDETGNITWERAWGPLLMGSFSFWVETGSTLAWSESAKLKRNLELFQAQVIDKVELLKRSGISNWRQMLKRMATQPPQFAPQPQKKPKAPPKPKK